MKDLAVSGWIPVHAVLRALALVGPSQLFEFSSDIFASSVAFLHILEHALSSPRAPILLQPSPLPSSGFRSQLKGHFQRVPQLPGLVTASPRNTLASSSLCSYFCLDCWG